MSELKFDRSSTDAVVWAKAWMEVFTDQSINGISEGFEYEEWMVGWFANAMCAQLDADEKRIATLKAQLAEIGELRDEMAVSECGPFTNSRENTGWKNARNFYRAELTAILAKSKK